MVAYVHIEYSTYQFLEESKGGWNPERVKVISGVFKQDGTGSDVSILHYLGEKEVGNKLLLLLWHVKDVHEPEYQQVRGHVVEA